LSTVVPKGEGRLFFHAGRCGYGWQANSNTIE